MKERRLAAQILEWSKVKSFIKEKERFEEYRGKAVSFWSETIFNAWCTSMKNMKLLEKKPSQIYKYLVDLGKCMA